MVPLQASENMASRIAEHHLGFGRWPAGWKSRRSRVVPGVVAVAVSSASDAVEARHQGRQGSLNRSRVHADRESLDLARGILGGQVESHAVDDATDVLLVFVITRPSTVTWEVRPMVWALCPGASLSAAREFRSCRYVDGDRAGVLLVRRIWSFVRSMEAVTPRGRVVDRGDEGRERVRDGL